MHFDTTYNIAEDTHKRIFKFSFFFLDIETTFVYRTQKNMPK